MTSWNLHLLLFPLLSVRAGRERARVCPPFSSCFPVSLFRSLRGRGDADINFACGAVGLGRRDILRYRFLLSCPVTTVLHIRARACWAVPICARIMIYDSFPRCIALYCIASLSRHWRCVYGYVLAFHAQAGCGRGLHIPSHPRTSTSSPGLFITQLHLARSLSIADIHAYTPHSSAQRSFLPNRSCRWKMRRRSDGGGDPSPVR